MQLGMRANQYCSTQDASSQPNVDLLTVNNMEAQYGFNDIRLNFLPPLFLFLFYLL